MSGRLIAMLLVLAVAAPPAFADSGGGVTATSKLAANASLYSCGKVRGKVNVRFKPDVTLKELVAWASGFSCKNFVYARGIGGRSAQVTIITPKKMSAGQAWRLFLVSLRSMGVTVVDKGNVFEIVEAAQAKGHALPLGRRAPRSSAQVTRLVIRPTHVSVDELGAALEALKSTAGSVVKLNGAGVLLVTDYASHVRKMVALRQVVDRPLPGEKLYAIRAVHVDAVQLTEKLREILKAPAGASAGPRARPGRGGREAAASSPAAIPSNMVADGRTNTLFVLASEAAYRRVKAVVARLDVAIGGDKIGHIHIYKLQNANAEKLAGSLNALIAGAQRATRPRGSRASPLPATGGKSHPSLEGEVRIGFDAPANALMMIASMRDYKALEQIIKTLDAPRRQVYVEVTILEVQAGSGFDLGVSFHGGKARRDGSIVLGGLQHPDLRSADVKGSLGKTGLLGGIIGTPLPGIDQFLGTSIPSFGAFFQAMSSRTDLEVISSPHVLTANNQPAVISSGENIPYKSGFAQQDPAGTLPQIQTVQRQKVALTLKITPQINASDIIRLDVDLQMSGLKKQDFEGLGATWTEHSIQNTVMVHDQESVVIGGLVKESNEKFVSKLPLLGDIPVLGHLFRHSTSKKNRSNILVVLTPHLVANHLDGHRIMQRRLRERREFLRSFAVLDAMRYRSRVDYSRKRGLIEEINQAVARAERDAAQLRELERKVVAPPDGEVLSRR